jgi:preprotein translocase subunit SecD
MSRRYVNLILILLVLAGALWVVLPNQGIKIGGFQRSLKTVLGLDLQGGLQVLLEADVPAGTPVDAQSLEDAKAILENRSNGLGVSEVLFQVAGDRRIVGEFPGLTNTQEVIDVLKQTGMLEFVDLGDTRLAEGTIIKTNLNSGSEASPATPTPAAGEATPSANNVSPQDKVWTTVMTGKELKSVGVTTDALGKYVVQFELKPDGQKIFADFTSKNVNKYLAIVLDKKIISAPVINSAITEGQGIIEGSFTSQSANDLSVQLRYGSLPIALKVVESRLIGPTLGQDSLNKSMVAGLIGFAIVTLFMIIFYRLPGSIAVLAIINYAIVTLALYKLIPVTLTLPGIAGFLLSTGGALDANILIFERLKEELRNGRQLGQALDLGWKRAWPSIRDSNVATLITSAILFWFGTAFGASIVKGFALTLALGVVISLINAIVVTRTFLNVVMDFIKTADHQKWFGA